MRSDKPRHKKAPSSREERRKAIKEWLEIATLLAGLAKLLGIIK
jgi:hypothetical protein